MKVYIDGEFYDKDDAKISVFDHGVLYGDGIFEGIRAYDGRVLALDEHLERLKESADAIFLALPIPIKKIREAVLESVRVNALRDAYIRLVITRGVGDLGLDMRKCHSRASLFIIADKIQLYPESVSTKGIELIISAIRQRSADQLSPNIKSLNYLANIVAREQATRAGAQEAVLLNREGYVTECSGDNIFCVHEKSVFTPPLHSGILGGVTRGIVMDLCRESLGIAVEEKLFTPFELYRAHEVFLTGTGAEVVGVSKIDGRPIGQGLPGPMTQKIISLFHKYAGSHGAPVYEEARARPSS
ncbi:MAG: branched-chain-amino-acid transaminase [Elusimicrobiota bacterium]